MECAQFRGEKRLLMSATKTLLHIIGPNSPGVLLCGSRWHKVWCNGLGCFSFIAMFYTRWINKNMTFADREITFWGHRWTGAALGHWSLSFLIIFFFFPFLSVTWLGGGNTKRKDCGGECLRRLQEEVYGVVQTKMRHLHLKHLTVVPISV